MAATDTRTQSYIYANCKMLPCAFGAFVTEDRQGKGKGTFHRSCNLQWCRTFCVKGKKRLPVRRGRGRRRRSIYSLQCDIPMSY